MCVPNCCFSYLKWWWFWLKPNSFFYFVHMLNDFYPRYSYDLNSRYFRWLEGLFLFIQSGVQILRIKSDLPTIYAQGLSFGSARTIIHGIGPSKKELELLFKMFIFLYQSNLHQTLSDCYYLQYVLEYSTLFNHDNHYFKKTKQQVFWFK